MEASVAVTPLPDRELAVVLLAAGCAPSFIRDRAGFSSVRAVRVFAADSDVRREVEERTKERAARLGRRALVALEQIVIAPHTDVRAHVLAIRTALEVSGDLRRGQLEPPARKVSELTVAELNVLIDATREELAARQWPDEQKQIGGIPPVAGA
jgi:hypothetical protein